jgi:hypothetical protein
MIRTDRELLADLARLNRELASLALRIMEGSASITEQQDYAQRLIAAGEQLQRRANEPVEVIIDGEVITNGPVILPELATEPYQES